VLGSRKERYTLVGRGGLGPGDPASAWNRRASVRYPEVLAVYAGSGLCLCGLSLGDGLDRAGGDREDDPVAKYEGDELPGEVDDVGEGYFVYVIVCAGDGVGASHGIALPCGGGWWWRDRASVVSWRGAGAWLF